MTFSFISPLSIGFFNDSVVVSASPIICRNVSGAIVNSSVLKVQMIADGVKSITGKISNGIWLGKV